MGRTESESGHGTPGKDNITSLDDVRRSRETPEVNPSAQSAVNTSTKSAALTATRPATNGASKNRRFNREKVDRLKAEIAAGDYEVDAERVADKFIEHDRRH